MSKRFNNHKIRSAGRGSPGGTSVNSVRQVAIAEIGILHHGDRNNLQDFKRKLGMYALRHFKDLGKMIELEEYYEPPVIPLPDDDAFDLDNDPHGTRKTIYLERVKMREKLVYEMESNRTSLYAVIWGQLSSESEEVVK